MPNPWDMDWSQNQASPAQASQKPWEMNWSADQNHPDKSLVDRGVELISTAAKAVDSVTGAPTRAAIYSAQNGKSPWEAAKNQFGNMSDEAPTGKDIATKAGISAQPIVNEERFKSLQQTDPGLLKAQGITRYNPKDYFSPAGVAGAGVDLAANPLNFAGPVLRVAGKGAEALTPIANKLRGFAEDTAVNATGATAKQASTFAPNAGRELLDRGIVRFGDSQAKISQRAAGAVEQANQQIDQSLSKLDASGVKVDANTVYNAVRKTINDMKADPSKADIANNLEKELDHLISATDVKGTTQFGMQEAENVKRGFKRKAGNWADPEKGMAGKEMYQTFRGAVEDAAQNADPSTAQNFIEGKKAYGLLDPIQEAAERRALTTNQHQAGGFLDVASSLAGESAGGPVMAIAAPVARRLISPRIGSSVAVAADKAANMVGQAPQIANMASQVTPIGGVASGIAAPQSMPAAAEETTPSKGPNKWANDGFQNLKSHSTDEERTLLDKYKGAMMFDPKTKQLLITASNYSPGSKPLNQIMAHLRNRFEKDK